MDFISNIFGYVLNFIYNIVQNYAVAIILFTLLLKALMLPFTYKQQKTMKKSAQIQEKIKIIQFKYKNDQEKMNQEMMALYKREKMNPFSGCLSGILQIIILLSVFYLVRSPLTYMKKIDQDVVNKYIEQVQTDENTTNKSAYPEINLIRWIRENGYSNEKLSDELIQLMDEKNVNNQDFNINMDFLGLDLSLVPSSALNNPEVYVIPVLYVISSIVSMKLSTNMTNTAKKKKNEEDDDENENQDNKPVPVEDTMATMNKSMVWLMPIMSVAISMIAPLGLALYWLTNNILMTTERIIINKILEKKEEKQDA